MKANAVIPGKPNSIHLREVTKPVLNGASGGLDVLVKVLRVGIDGTDKEINAAEYGAPPPGDDFLILGHESLGVVEAVGNGVRRFQPGDHVSVEPNIACDNCVNCLNNRQNFCLNWQAVGVTRQGGMAQWVTAPEKAVFNIGSLPFEAGAFMEPLSCVLHGNKVPQTEHQDHRR